MKTFKLNNIMNKLNLILLLLLIGCGKPEVQDVTLDTPDPVTNCIDDIVIEDGWTIQVPLQSSGSDKLIFRNTPGLRAMAYTGNINTLRNELACYGYSSRTVNILKTGHKSDINQIGFAPQLLIEGEWIVAMYHPNNFPDHFIIYNIDTKEWFRYDHSEQEIYLQGSGD